MGGSAMIIYEYINSEQIVAKSDSRKYLDDVTDRIYDRYIEIGNYGYIDENSIGHFDNGHIVTESDKEIPTEEVNDNE